MRVKILVEDRENAYLFLDVTNAPEDTQEYELVLLGVSFSEIEDETLASWMETVDGKLEVIPRREFEKLLQNSTDTTNDRWPIPTPSIWLDENDLVSHEIREDRKNRLNPAF